MIYLLVFHLAILYNCLETSKKTRVPSLEKCLGQYLPQATLLFVMCQVQGSGKRWWEHRCAANDKGLSQSFLHLESSDCLLSDSSLFLLMKHLEERFSAEGKFPYSSMSSIVHKISLENSLGIHFWFTCVWKLEAKPFISLLNNAWMKPQPRHMASDVWRSVDSLRRFF